MKWNAKTRLPGHLKLFDIYTAVYRAVFPNLFWFAAPLLSFEDIWRHPWLVS